MKRNSIIPIAVILLMFGMVCNAEEQVKVTGNTIKGDTEKKITYLDGNVKIIQGSNIILTEKAKIDLDNKLLYLENQVVFNGPDVTIQALTLDYNLKKKNGTFKTDVVLKRKEKKENGKNQKDPFTLIADEMYFDSESKNFVATKGKIEHKDFNGSADRIDYDDQQQLLVLTGNAYLKRPEGEEVWGDSTKINLKDKSFTVEKNVTVNFDVDDEKTPAKDSAKETSK